MHLRDQVAMSRGATDEAAGLLRTESPESTLSIWIINLESYESIRAFTEQRATLPRIDIVILNAGLAKPSYPTVPETRIRGDATGQLPIYGTSEDPTSSHSWSLEGYQRSKAACPYHRGFNRPRAFSQLLWYRKSKPLLTFFVSTLAECVRTGDVPLNLMNPRMASGIAFLRESSTTAVKLMSVAHFLFARGVDVVATTYVDAASAYGEESHGSFTGDWAIKP
ncbi:hypothetical protein DL765_006533 [Monosporascus sp. GIB2]|nr:hypothetical protein DL765_006533 [Monosporascus sp. GIB2]